jgi:hypothetical protein
MQLHFDMEEHIIVSAANCIFVRIYIRRRVVSVASELGANNGVVYAKVIPLLTAENLSSDFHATFFIHVDHEWGIPEYKAAIITVKSTSLNLIRR